MVVVTTLMPTHKIKDCLSGCIFIDLLARVSDACG